MAENNDPNMGADAPKPSNPQMDAVSANQPTPQTPEAQSVSPQSTEQPASEPVPTPTPTPTPTTTPTPTPAGSQVSPSQPKVVVPVSGKAPTPKKIGKEKSAKGKKKFLLGCAGGFIFLFILFIVLMVLMISRSGASNPVMTAFGLDPGGVRNFLQGVVGFSFGMLSFLFLVLAVIGLFKFLGAQKSDKEKRRRNAKMTALSTLSLAFVVFVWAILATYIGRIEIAAERVIAEIVVISPDDLTALEAPVEITFSALNVATALSQSGVAIESMNWDLDGDGSYETPVTRGNPEVTRLYNRRGAVSVGLQVQVFEEEDRIFTKLIDIQDATFDADPSTGTAPLVVQFDAGSLIDKSSVASLDWDFDGDGQYDIEGPDNVRPRYTFEQIGTYSVALRVINDNNTVENYQRDIEIVTSDQPILSAQIDASPALEGAIPFQVRFDADRSTSLKGNIIKYEWDFGDGSDLQSGKSVSHVFDEAGFYTVALSVEDNLGNEATSSVEIEAQSISSIPEAVIDTIPAIDGETGTLTGVLPFKVEFNAGNSLDADNDIVDFMWDFDGDGTTDQEGAKIEYTFEEARTFAVKLTVADTEGQSGSATLNVVVEEPGVQSKISATPEEGTAPLTVQFDGSSSSTFNGNIVSYEWDFGDGSPKTITGAVVSHKYNSVGTYEVKLKVVTNNNESASSTKLVYVREIPLKACFTPSRTSGLAPLTVSFDSKCSTGGIASYNYQYGDGGESTSANPTHTFEFPGTYTITLEVTNDKNNVDSYQEVIVAEGAITE